MSQNQSLIPRDVLFGNPERSSPLISPNSEKIAYLAPDDRDVMQVWIVAREADQGSAAVCVTKDKKRGIRSFQWSEDGQSILYLQDSDGDENWHIFSTHLETLVTRDLTPFLGCQAMILASHRDFPRQLLVTTNTRDPQLHDVYRVDLDTGAIVLDTQNPGDAVGWLADDKYQIRALQAPTAEGGFVIRVRDSVDDDWREFLSISQEDADTAMISFSKDGQSLYLQSCVGANTLRLIKKSIATGEETVLAGAEDSDLQEVIFDKQERVPQAAAFGRARLEWQALDDSLAKHLENFKELHHGDPIPVNRDNSDRYWLIAFTTDNGPVPYYIYDCESGQGRLLFTSRPSLEQYQLAPMQAVEIDARDGLKLPSYLSVPVTGEKPYPLILNVHGGPWVRDHWGYHPEVQWMCNRGYAVLQVNYRGSTGFGKKFLHAGDREWGGKMHDDLIDAVNWAVESGVADPEKIAIYGGSYGGFASLCGAAFTPEVFTCAVDIVGVSSIITLLNSFPPYWEPLKKMFESRVGRADEVEFLKSRSPLYSADKIKIPLLIAQGANDPRVKQAESEQIVEAVRKNGQDVEYLLFEDEGHGFARPENKMLFYAAAEKFLHTHLGGLFQEADPENKAS